MRDGLSPLSCDWKMCESDEFHMNVVRKLAVATIGNSDKEISFLSGVYPHQRYILPEGDVWFYPHSIQSFDPMI